jgi:hypothetical protein
VQAIGLALLVLFFVVGVMRTCGNFAEVKRPEQALKLFIRFAIAKGAVTYGLELMMALFKIVQGMISTIMNAAGFGSAQQTVLPQEIVTAVEDCGFFESIPLWAVTLIGGLFITVLSFIMIMSVYGRFFKLYIYTAIAPVPLSAFAGEPSQSVGKSFIKSYAAVCLEGAVIVLACIIFSLLCVPEGYRYPLSCKIWHSSKPFLKSNGKALSATAMSFCIWAATSKAPTNMCQNFWARKPLIPTPTGKALGGVVTIQQIIRFRGVS